MKKNGAAREILLSRETASLLATGIVPPEKLLKWDNRDMEKVPLYTVIRGGAYLASSDFFCSGNSRRAIHAQLRYRHGITLL